MAINLQAPEPETELKPRITVFGVGGAGGNAVNNMIRSGLQGVEFVVSNTDAQALHESLAEKKIQLGSAYTSGLGAGSRPEVGRASAEEAKDDILNHIHGSNMVFITAGMGGGTGTGAGPMIAELAKNEGILTVGVVTKPFQFEGVQRMRIAESGIQELTQHVDTLIVIPNQNLFRVANEKTTFADAFKMADDVLCSGVRGVTDLMLRPGLINLDFADIRSVMHAMGKAMMGTGEATGETRAIDAAEDAISNPLLEDVSMRGARGVLINITGGLDMTLFEVDEAANRIREEVDSEANIIFGSTFDESMEGIMRISVVATGIEKTGQIRPEPVSSLFGESSTQTEAFTEENAATEATTQGSHQDTTHLHTQSTLTTDPDSAQGLHRVGELPFESTSSTGQQTSEETTATSFVAPEPEDTSPDYVQDYVAPQKESLFRRLVGLKRKHPETVPSHTEVGRKAPTQCAPEPTSTTGPHQDVVSDPLEVPAFLRRKRNL